VAISRLPWLMALHAFATCGTWTRGYHFTRDSAMPDAAALPIPFGLRATPAIQFESERRRGWVESGDSPPREAGGAWDQHRNARIEKPRPGGGPVLHAESIGHAGGEFAEQAIDGLRVRYWLEQDADAMILDDHQWADWDCSWPLARVSCRSAMSVPDRRPWCSRPTCPGSSPRPRRRPRLRAGGASQRYNRAARGRCSRL
jgi:hypothetical protein